MNWLHRFTIGVRKVLVLTLAFGIGLPLAFAIYWLCPDDWREKHKPMKEQ